MLFNSLDFLIFFPIVILIYFVIPRRIKHIWLLVASYYFYMCWSPKYAILIAVSTIITFLSGVLIDDIRRASNNTKKMKLVVAFSFITNIGILAFFKYLDWLLESAACVFGADLSLPFSIVLPVGISFYTFQALSYTVDVYRDNVRVERDLFKYALFVSFFPQLVAGPIERSGNLLKQIRAVGKKNLVSFDKIKSGLMLMIWGFFLKMVIADRAAIVVDNVFKNFKHYHASGLILGIICFSVQIYCDFASYSTIAVGAAKVMGFELSENFNTPYFAMSIKEFWQRWHISLSTWFKDYLYIPLGGNRCSKFKNYFNLMITFIVSGLWHGANWTFVVWGALHGIYQIFGNATLTIRKKLLRAVNASVDTITFKMSKVILNFILVSFAWIFFRSESVADAVIYIKRIFTCPDIWSLFDGRLYKYGLNQFQMHVLAVSLLVLFIFSLIKRFKNMNFDEFLNSQGFIFKCLTMIVLVVVIIVYGRYGAGFDAKQFIYFQF